MWHPIKKWELWRWCFHICLSVYRGVRSGLPQCHGTGRPLRRQIPPQNADLPQKAHSLRRQTPSHARIQVLWTTVNKRMVRTLLECTLAFQTSTLGIDWWGCQPRRIYIMNWYFDWFCPGMFSLININIIETTTYLSDSDLYEWSQKVLFLLINFDGILNKGKK